MRKNTWSYILTTLEIPVIWEDNQTVQELMEEAGKGDIVVQMSMYSDNEQVGSLGKSYTKNDEQITTHSGDIVLYSGDKIVVFYGSNSWAYTRLGENEYSRRWCDRTFVKWGYHFENSNCEIVSKSECCFLLQGNRQVPIYGIDNQLFYY